MTTRMTQGDKKTIVDMYSKQMKSAEFIAHTLNRSPSTIRRYLQSIDLYIPQKKQDFRLPTGVRDTKRKCSGVTDAMRKASTKKLDELTSARKKRLDELLMVV